MAKLGIALKIDVTKIDKTRLFQGKNGAQYLDLTTFIDTEKQGQYGDHGFITQSLSKEERQNKVRLPILGNTTVFYSDLENSTPPVPTSAVTEEDDEEPNDEMPF